MLNPENPLDSQIIEQLGEAPSFLHHSPVSKKNQSNTSKSLQNVSGYKYNGYQFFYGSFATGSPQHVHGPSWNYLARGKKLWWFWKPARAAYSKVPPLEGIKMWELQADFSCFQEGGDVMLVPENWGHSTFVLEESVGVAVEYRHDRVGAHSRLSIPPPAHLL